MRIHYVWKGMVATAAVLTICVAPNAGATPKTIVHEQRSSQPSSADQKSLSSVENQEVSELMKDYSVKGRKVQQQHDKAVKIVKRLSAKHEFLPGFGPSKDYESVKMPSQSSDAATSSKGRYLTSAGCHDDIVRTIHYGLSPFPTNWLAHPALHISFCNNAQDYIDRAGIQATISGGIYQWAYDVGMNFSDDDPALYTQDNTEVGWQSTGSLQTCYGFKIFTICSYSDDFIIAAYVQREQPSPGKIQDWVFFYGGGSGSHADQVNMEEKKGQVVRVK
jgi:hypothetical protein